MHHVPEMGQHKPSNAYIFVSSQLTWTNMKGPLLNQTLLKQLLKTWSRISQEAEEPEGENTIRGTPGQGFEEMPEAS